MPWWAWLVAGIAIGVIGAGIYGAIWLIRNNPFKNF
jgi:hypothetical protein